MRKTLISLLFVLTIASLSWGLNAQSLVGNQLSTTVQITSYGAIQNALVSLPDDYNNTTGKYPLLIFLHGSGEVGKSAADLSKEIKVGLPLVIARGAKIQATNPKDGKLYKFIVISPQHWGWTTTPESLEYMLATLPKSYRIDTSRIYLTGLSAGGQGVIQAATYSQQLTNKIAAIVPMSPSAPDGSFTKNFKFFAQSKTGAWFFSGSKDTGPYTANAKMYSDSINKYNPSSSAVTLYSATHCCWDVIYTPSHKENGMSIYEWMLQYQQGGEDAISPVPVKNYRAYLDSAQNISKIIVLLKTGKYMQYDSSNIKMEVK